MRIRRVYTSVVENTLFLGMAIGYDVLKFFRDFVYHYDKSIFIFLFFFIILNERRLYCFRYVIVRGFVLVSVPLSRF